MSTTLNTTPRVTGLSGANATRGEFDNAIRTDLGFKALCSKRGVTRSKLWELTGWVRKPMPSHLRRWAANYDMKLVEQASARGETIYRFVS